MSTIRLVFQGELVKATVADDVPNKHQNARSATRGNITDFSRKSRKRLFELCATLDWKKTRARFVSLTYHNKIPPLGITRKHLRAFIKRVWRQYGMCAVLWRLEFQERGAPHFHMLFFDGKYMPRDVLLRWWREITEDDTINQLDIRYIYSSRKARAYISKYIAKLPVDGDVSTSLDTVPYPAATDFLGRVWGVENRALLCYALAMVIETIDVWAFWSLKRAARKVYRAINGRERAGFTLFVENSDRWYEYLLYLLLS